MKMKPGMGLFHDEENIRRLSVDCRVTELITWKIFILFA